MCVAPPTYLISRTRKRTPGEALWGGEITTRHVFDVHVATCAGINEFGTVKERSSSSGRGISDKRLDG